VADYRFEVFKAVTVTLKADTAIADAGVLD
jgi:hypothetical protein